jgi:LIM domain
MNFISDVLEDGEASFCAACRNEVEEGEFVHALNQDWHLECFRFVPSFCSNFKHYNGLFKHPLGVLPVMLLSRAGILKKTAFSSARMTTAQNLANPVSNADRYFLLRQF